ncbi:MAG: helix-turn-helix transcriptional regulator [Victivallales bacterium]|jgi:transcriptional regulator with XRE-family HTH domain
MNIRTLVEKEIEKGVSRRELARRVGVSLGTVQNVLLGDIEIKNSTLNKFSRYFGEPIIDYKITNKGGDDPRMKIALAHIELLTKNLVACERELAEAKEKIARLTGGAVERRKSGGA